MRLPTMYFHVFGLLLVLPTLSVFLCFWDHFLSLGGSASPHFIFQYKYTYPWHCPVFFFLEMSLFHFWIWKVSLLCLEFFVMEHYLWVLRNIIYYLIPYLCLSGKDEFQSSICLFLWAAQRFTHLSYAHWRPPSPLFYTMVNHLQSFDFSSTTSFSIITILAFCLFACLLFYFSIFITFIHILI